jgi:hypothetical protein
MVVHRRRRRRQQRLQAARTTTTTTTTKMKNNGDSDSSVRLQPRFIAKDMNIVDSSDDARREGKDIMIRTCRSVHVRDRSISAVAEASIRVKCQSTDGGGVVFECACVLLQSYASDDDERGRDRGKSLEEP